MAIDDSLLDQLMAGYQKPEDLLGDEGLFKKLKKALMERALDAELTHHLGMPGMIPPGGGAATVATAIAEKPFRPKTGRWTSTFPATATAASSR